jgi:hypothetical protein
MLLLRTIHTSHMYECAGGTRSHTYYRVRQRFSILVVHSASRGVLDPQTIKGTVARDCRPLVFFMNRPHMGL